MLVAKLGDQLELVVDEAPDVFGRSFRKTPGETCVRLLAQMARRRLAFGNELGRIFVAQRAEIEVAALGDARGLREQVRRINLREMRAAPQMPLGVRMQRCRLPIRTGTPSRIAVSTSCSGRRERTCMCTSPAAASGRPLCLASSVNAASSRSIVGTVNELDCNPRAPGKTLRDEARVLGVRRRVRNEQREAAGQALIEIAALEAIFAFGRAHASPRDQRAHRAIARAVRCEQHELRSVVELQLPCR